MLEQEFLTSLKKYTSDLTQPQIMWNEVMENYSQPGRYYHNIGHLNSLLAELKLYQDKFSDWDATIFAIAYHDLIYNPLKDDNEEQSAILARKRLTTISLSEHSIAFCCHLIVSTKRHESSDMETNLFTDADLAILGSDSQAYVQYTNQIRREYAIYPDRVYNSGREEVLEHFLTMSPIFKTKEFSDKYEIRARENILTELNALKS